MSQFTSDKNPRVWMDIEIGGNLAGTIVFELFKNVVPRTAENFRQLCVGDFKSKFSKKILQY